jgi:pimeloyl-ACP methyl ester carboxylesterase
MSVMSTTIETVAVRHCDFEAKVTVGGTGSPVVYLHTAGGPRWDPFLDALAERHTVYAPDHPGTGATARDAIHSVDDLWDLVLIYDELLDGLGLGSVPVIGSSFGGMVACELAALRRDRVSRLILIDPIGLWLDDNPVTQYMLLPQDQLIATLFENTEAEPVKQFLTLPEDPDEMAVAIADSIWALGTTGKFVWPIPDKGLKKRLHRIDAPTLIIWGEHDRLISPVYAQEFANRIAGSTVQIVRGAGHVPQWEQLDVVGPLVTGFLEG